MSAAAPASAGDDAPGCATTVADVFHAAISTFPAPSHMQTDGQATSRHRQSSPLVPPKWALGSP